MENHQEHKVHQERREGGAAREAHQSFLVLLVSLVVENGPPRESRSPQIGRLAPA